MPSYSIGFWVAMTMNGAGKGRVTPSTVTWRSSMASSSADWVFGVARLISSVRTTCAMTGPGRNSNSLGRLVEDGDASHVGGQQVRRELDALEAAAGRSCERAREHGLADAGDVLEQEVAAAEQRDEGEPRFLGFADDDAFDVVEQALGNDAGLFQLALQPAQRWCGLAPKPSIATRRANDATPAARAVTLQSGYDRLSFPRELPSTADLRRRMERR